MPSSVDPDHCRVLAGSVEENGWSVCDHRYPAAERTDWSDCFHANTAGFCFNYAGEASVATGRTSVKFSPGSTGIFNLPRASVTALREVSPEHSFLTVHFTRDWLAQEMRQLPKADWARLDHPLLETGNRAALFVRPLTRTEAAFGEALRQPPVASSGWHLWYQSKVLELLAVQLFGPPVPTEMFCTRQKHVAHARVEQARQLVRDNLAEPLSLQELSRRIGCSSFYLCRLFSAETGLTLSQFLRKERIHRAADLLQGGRYNVTEAALEVGYNSLSHFSKAFLEEMGCCPGLYPAGTHLFRSKKSA
jgi:AraC-like DNA-binding protein